MLTGSESPNILRALGLHAMTIVVVAKARQSRRALPRVTFSEQPLQLAPRSARPMRGVLCPSLSPPPMPSPPLSLSLSPRPRPFRLPAPSCFAWLSCRGQSFSSRGSRPCPLQAAATSPGRDQRCPGHRSSRTSFSRLSRAPVWGFSS